MWGVKSVEFQEFHLFQNQDDLVVSTLVDFYEILWGDYSTGKL